MKKTIVITGASSGIGRSTAEKFQKEGWNVVATMRSPEKEESLNQLDNVLVTKLDVLDIDTIDSALAAAIEKFGKIDVILNNAGYAVAGVFEATKRESVMRQFGVNVQGLMDVTQKALPHFRANKEGMFINISSVGGKMTFPLMSLYHGTKFAVEGFSESLHWELAEIGVKVKIVEPGGVDTDFSTRSLDLHHNPELAEYNDFVAGFMKAMEQRDRSMMSTPDMIADVIYNAATDGTNKLRYRAGADAEQLLTSRKNMTDEAFFEMWAKQLAIAE